MRARRYVDWLTGAGVLAVLLAFTASGALDVVVRSLAVIAVLAIVATARTRPGARETPNHKRIAYEEQRIVSEASRVTQTRTERTRETHQGRRSREQYLAAVSHELRTPLNAILGFTQVLLSEIDGPLSPPQREDVTAINDAGAHLRALVEEVIGHSASDSTETDAIGPVAIEPLVREIARGLEAQLRGRPITLHLSVEPELPSPIGDARRIRQIVWNLGTNAVKFTDQGEIAITVRRDGEALRFSVRDTGRGIPAGDLGRIFSAHEQVDASRSGSVPRQRTKTEGWGLGLAIAREMAEFHRGRLEVESELGKGSTFHFVMPVKGREPRA
jgi:two-component system sensor histidine kinase/response regulator